MKRIIFIVITIVLFSSVANAQENNDLLNACQKWLRSNSIPFTKSSDNELIFKHQGRTFYLQVPEDDKNFLHLILPNIYDVSASEKDRVLEILNSINRDRKCVKAILRENKVLLAIEILAASSPEFNNFFERFLDILHGVYWEFATTVVNMDSPDLYMEERSN